MNGDEAVDAELERKNFDFAGQTLAEIWSGVIIDNFPVVAEYITPENSELPGDEIFRQSQQWFDNHVRTSQYLLQIVKYTDVDCCNPPRSSYLSLLLDRFLPSFRPLSETSSGVKIPEISKDGSNLIFPSLFVALQMDTSYLFLE